MKGNIRMDKFDQYKRLLRLGIAGIEIFIETLFFVYVWNSFLWKDSMYEQN